jgi:hypothetical protein
LQPGSKHDAETRHPLQRRVVLASKGAYGRGRGSRINSAASLNVAATIAAHVFDKGLARVPPRRHRGASARNGIPAGLPGARMSGAEVLSRSGPENAATIAKPHPHTT